MLREGGSQADRVSALSGNNKLWVPGDCSGDPREIREEEVPELDWRGEETSEQIQEVSGIGNLQGRETIAWPGPKEVRLDTSHLLKEVYFQAMDAKHTTEAALLVWARQVCSIQV